MNHRRSSRLSPEFVLLGFLYQHPGHGYQLHQRLSGDFGNIWHASQSQTYAILKRLEAQGYVTSVSMVQTKLPARQLLQITESGKERFAGWLAEPTKSSVHAIRVEFVTRLYFLSMYYPEKIKEMILAQIGIVDAGLKELDADLKDLSDSQTFERLALELRIKLLNSVVLWLNECLSTFTYEQGSGVNSD